jgi:hypothetical protein
MGIPSQLVFNDNAASLLDLIRFCFSFFRLNIQNFLDPVFCIDEMTFADPFRKTKVNARMFTGDVKRKPRSISLSRCILPEADDPNSSTICRFLSYGSGASRFLISSTDSGPKYRMAPERSMRALRRLKA